MKALSWSLLTVMLAISLLALGGQRASAQSYPQVADLRPFSPDANYMSLPGLLRWQVFLTQGTWLSPEVAISIVRDQEMVASAR